MSTPTDVSIRTHGARGALAHRQNVVVFDIGGSWFRSAVSTPAGILVGATRRPAISFHRHPELEVSVLQAGLLDYLVGESERLAREHGPCPTAVISMGAALNAHTGFVFNSGPLWGPRCEPIDLLTPIRRRAPSCSWQVINDVTAALLRHVATFGERRHGRTALLTISSGIACRVFDFARRCVPTDPVHGLQGEIGHLATDFAFDGTPVHLDCDCGGRDHLNAFASGRGLEAVLRHLATSRGSGFATSSLAGADAAAPPAIDDYLRAVQAGDPWCRGVLAAAMRPLAKMLLVMLAHDPELDPIVLVGGVAATLGECLVSTVVEQLDELGMYQITERDQDYFRQRLRLGCIDDDSGLIGCGLFARDYDLCHRADPDPSANRR